MPFVFKGHFLLTHLLMDLMIDPIRPSRIINVSSDGHFRGTINFDDLMFAKKYHNFDTYCQSKLANVLFTRELTRRLKGLSRFFSSFVEMHFVYVSVGGIMFVSVINMEQCYQLIYSTITKQHWCGITCDLWLSLTPLRPCTADRLVKSSQDPCYFISLLFAFNSFACYIRVYYMF